ncbi:GHRHR protein, partial [Polyodon spathula]|nr:GHRHR protein [Polyodon spathula]
LHPECEFIFQLEKDQQKCLKEISENENHTTGGTKQNAVYCYYSGTAGRLVSCSTPTVYALYQLTLLLGTVSRNCTINGWSNPFPPYYLACTVEDEIPVEEESYFATVKVIYTVGYGASIFSLTIATIILLNFRSLHCARNYVHVQLFTSFILRAAAVFIKDATLFANDETDHCTFSTAGCKAAVVFCHYCVMTNFFWLLVEALYLNSLLFSFIHPGRNYFGWFVMLGWGK